VFIDTSNMTSTGNCLYYSPGYAAQALNAAGTSQTTAGSIGLGNWDVSETGNGTGSSWYEGNIQTCANKGMRLPTLYETTAASPSSYKPADPELTWAATATGVPHSGGNWTWTSSAYTSNTSYYLIWYGTTSSYYNYDYAYHAVRCVVP
jgi:hypothetical protein